MSTTLTLPTPPPPRAVPRAADSTGLLGWFSLSIILSLGSDLYHRKQLVAGFWDNADARSIIAQYPESGPVLLGLIVLAVYAVVGVYHAFGLITVWQLARVRKNAIVWLRFYLIFRLGIFSLVLWALDFKGNDNWTAALMSLFWLAYFAQSEKFRLTFGAHPLRQITPAP